MERSILTGAPEGIVKAAAGVTAVGAEIARNRLQRAVIACTTSTRVAAARSAKYRVPRSIAGATDYPAATARFAKPAKPVVLVRPATEDARAATVFDATLRNTVAVEASAGIANSVSGVRSVVDVRHVLASAPTGIASVTRGDVGTVNGVIAVPPVIDAVDALAPVRVATACVEHRMVPAWLARTRTITIGNSRTTIRKSALPGRL